jgi:hypothetical protein
VGEGVAAIDVTEQLTEPDQGVGSPLDREAAVEVVVEWVALGGLRSPAVSRDKGAAVVTRVSAIILGQLWISM